LPGLRIKVTIAFCQNDKKSVQLKSSDREQEDVTLVVNAEAIPLWISVWPG